MSQVAETRPLVVTRTRSLEWRLLQGWRAVVGGELEVEAAEGGADGAGQGLGLADEAGEDAGAAFGRLVEEEAAALGPRREGLGEEGSLRWRGSGRCIDRHLGQFNFPLG